MTVRKKWRFSLWPMLAFACVLPLLAWLGAWQVQRGTQKAVAYENFAQAMESAARDITGLAVDEINALPRYRHVRLRGHYAEDRQFLLDNMSHNGQPGHHVLTPFVPVGADYVVIVDRGWRPGLARNQLDTQPLKGGVESVTGLLAPLPRPGLRLEGGSVQGGWPRVVQFPTAQDLGLMLETPVATPRLLLNPDAQEGYVREWEPPGIPPARHYAYAFQWFALALALIVIFIVMARPRQTEDSAE